MRDQPTGSRRELASDPHALEPMGQSFDDALDSGLAMLGLTDAVAGSTAARRSFEAHARLLREWNAAINLTAVRDPAAIATRHVIDSLTAVPQLVAHAAGASLLDLGSGGGYPGLPLAAALPLARVALLDSVTKKARFLAVAAAAVTALLAEDDREPPAIEAVAERAEDLAEDPDQRAGWDIVTARAVGSLAEVLELGLPLTSDGGRVVAWKRDDGRDGLRDELRDAGSIIRAAGGGRPAVVDVGTADLPGHRLVIVARERPTPPAYPRPPAVRRARHR